MSFLSRYFSFLWFDHQFIMLDHNFAKFFRNITIIIPSLNLMIFYHTWDNLTKLIRYLDLFMFTYNILKDLLSSICLFVPVSHQEHTELVFFLTFWSRAFFKQLPHSPSKFKVLQVFLQSLFVCQIASSRFVLRPPPNGAFS